MADATYATLDDLRGPDGNLDQYTITDTGMPDERNDLFLQSCLNDAQAILDGELGFTLAAAATGTQVVYGDGTAYLTPPPHTPGSVTLVTPPTGYTVPSYVQQNGVLRTTDSTGILAPYPYGSPSYYPYNPFASSSSVWAPGVPYTVSASYGAAAADLLVCRRLTLELAVNLWKFKDAGGSAAVGSESSIVLVKEALNATLRRAIERLKQKYAPSMGVW